MSRVVIREAALALQETFRGWYETELLGKKSGLEAGRPDERDGYGWLALSANALSRDSALIRQDPSEPGHPIIPSFFLSQCHRLRSASEHIMVLFLE